MIASQSERRSEQMIPVKKQFLYDEQHHPVQVVLDYADWQKIEQALGEVVAKPNGSRLNSFAGKISFGDSPLEVQRELRAEWPD